MCPACAVSADDMGLVTIAGSDPSVDAAVMRASLIIAGGGESPLRTACQLQEGQRSSVLQLSPLYNWDYIKHVSK